MTILALKCVPYVIAALIALNFVGLGRGENPFLLPVQMLCWLILIAHVPVIVAAGVWKFIRWQVSLAEHRRTADPICSTPGVRVLSSFKFMNGCALICLGMLSLAVIVSAYEGLRQWLAAYEVLQYVPWSHAGLGLIVIVCAALVGSGAFLVVLAFVSGARQLWQRRTIHQGESLSYLGEGR